MSQGDAEEFGIQVVNQTAGGEYYLPIKYMMSGKQFDSFGSCLAQW